MIKMVEQLIRAHSNENLSKQKSSPALNASSNAKSTNCLTNDNVRIQNEQLDECKAFIQQQKVIEQKIHQQNKKLKHYRMQKQLREQQLRPENQFLSASLFFDPAAFKAQLSQFNRSSSHSNNKSKSNSLKYRNTQ